MFARMHIYLVGVERGNYEFSLLGIQFQVTFVQKGNLILSQECASFGISTPPVHNQVNSGQFIQAVRHVQKYLISVEMSVRKMCSQQY